MHNSIEEFNRLLAAENKEYMNEIDDIGETVPIRIEKIDNLMKMMNIKNYPQ